MQKVHQGCPAQELWLLRAITGSRQPGRQKRRCTVLARALAAEPGNIARSAQRTIISGIANWAEFTAWSKTAIFVAVQARQVRRSRARSVRKKAVHIDCYFGALAAQTMRVAAHFVRHLRLCELAKKAQHGCEADFETHYCF